MANFTCAEGNGTWAEKIVVSEDDLIKVPEGVTDEEACQLLVNPTTVVAMVERSGVREGDWIIQSAAGSALGRQLISYCKHIGVKTINVVRHVLYCPLSSPPPPSSTHSAPLRSRDLSLLYLSPLIPSFLLSSLYPLTPTPSLLS